MPTPLEYEPYSNAAVFYAESRVGSLLKGPDSFPQAIVLLAVQDGYDAGAKSRDAEVAALQQRLDRALKNADALADGEL